MKSILQYIRRYFEAVNKKTLILVTLFTAVLVFINYQYGLDGAIRKINSAGIKLIHWYGVFLIAFGIPYLLAGFFGPVSFSGKKKFLFLLFTAPFIFALKLSLDIPIGFPTNANWNNYWNHILYWPLLLAIIGGILYVYWRLLDREQPFYGFTQKNLEWKPYLLMLLFMVPLIAAASTQRDFLEVYPKLQSIAAVYNEEGMTWMHKLLFELAYGTDFIGIELFFRGFLILAFIKWAGKDAILPVACFYCTIHFGKPMGECISSYFGGLVLGIIVYNTRSILGGLLVHLGIAWMMELGGYIGNAY
jgi:membrane protease YdiL (CAAX protease family)